MKSKFRVVSGGAGAPFAALLVVAMAFAAVACSQPEEKDDDPDDEVIGSPPSADEDPFFVEGKPEDAEEAESRGSIGEDEKQREAQQEDDEVERRRRCFSCVKICPAGEECDTGSAEVICGWGVHRDAEEAKKRARAECNATLDMSRYMPVWSEIKGECPAATCQ
ncbi:MAG: hypothetical protein ACOCV2_10210 [Persicimonas sp.]